MNEAPFFVTAQPLRHQVTKLTGFLIKIPKVLTFRSPSLCLRGLVAELITFFNFTQETLRTPPGGQEKGV
jgi:hypothetical protein